MRYPALAFRLLLLFLASFTLAGCLVVPIKMRTLQQTAAGQRTLVPSAPIVPGTTSWQDLQVQYEDIAVDSGDPDLFLAQYRTSGWALVYGVGGLGAAQVGGGRLWDEIDIVATFDKEGLVKTFDQVPERQLGERIAQMQKRGQLSELNFTAPVRLNGQKTLVADTPVQIDLSLRDLNIQVTPPAKKKKAPPPLIATLTAAQIAKLDLEAQDQWAPDAFRTRPFTVMLKFSASTAIGKKLQVDLEPADALTLVRWLAQQGSPPQPEKASPSPTP